MSADTDPSLGWLKWRGVWLPTLAIGALLFVEGILENYPINDWKTHLLTSHVLIVGIISVGTYLFSTWTFKLVHRGHEEILRKSAQIAGFERRFRALVEHGTDFVALLDGDGAVLYISPSFTRNLGYTPTETIGRSVLDLIVPFDHQDVRNIVDKSVKKPKSVLSVSCRIYHKNGDWYWIRVSLTNLLADPDVGAIVWNAHDITDWRQADDSLRSLTEGLPIGVYRTTATGQLLDANPALAQMLGYPDRRALLAVKATDLYADPSDRLRWQALMARDGIVRNFEFRARLHDGRIVWLQNSARVVRDEHKGMSYYEGAVEDVTERKRADQLLIERQAQLADILESAMDAIITLDSNQQVVLFNAAAERMFSCSVREAIGRSIERFIPEWREAGQQARFRALGQNAATERHGWKPEGLTGRRSRGIVFPLDAVVWKSISSGVTLYTLSLRDSTERRQAEDTLRKLSRAIDQAGESIFITDQNGVIEYTNPAFETVTGFARSEAIGKRPTILRSGVHDEASYDEFKKKLMSATAFKTVFTNRRKDGQIYHLEETVSPIMDAQKTITHFVSIGRDITHRKRTEEALRRLNVQLEREAERIAHALHDDAGQFLTSAHITLADVARDLPDAAQSRLREVRDHLDQIEEHLRRLSHELRPRILDDLGLAAALEFLAEGVMKRTGIIVTTEVVLEERLPLVVETTLYRLIQEALTNAAKHARPTRVNVLVVRTGRTIRCAIRDDGVGFDAEDIFARRGDPSLGLVGTRDRVEALGGTLGITSTPGQGTELLVLIPVDPTEV